MSTTPGPPDEPVAEPLTCQERQLLGLVVQGFSAAEIAEQLALTVRSVKQQIVQLYDKPGVNNQQRATLRAAATSNGPGTMPQCVTSWDGRLIML